MPKSKSVPIFAKVGPCRHKKHHEKYSECTGDMGGYIGEVWETGIRCTKCGRKWPDPEIEARYRADDHRRSWEHYCIEFGTDQTILMSLTCERGNVDEFHRAYNDVRRIMTEKDEFNEPGDPYYVAPEQIGPIEDKFFVFHDDCKELKKPVKDPHPEAGWKMPFHDEWNLFGNLGIRDPMPEVCHKYWVKRRLTYQQALEKIRADHGVSYEDHPLGLKQHKKYESKRHT